MMAVVAGQEQRSGSIVRVLRIVARNKAEASRACLRGVQRGRVGTWLAMLVYAYAHGGVTAAGVVAIAMLVPAAVSAPPLAAFAERHAPGRVLAAGYLGQAASCAFVAASRRDSDADSFPLSFVSWV